MAKTVLFLQAQRFRGAGLHRILMYFTSLPFPKTRHNLEDKWSTTNSAKQQPRYRHDAYRELSGSTFTQTRGVGLEDAFSHLCCGKAAVCSDMNSSSVCVRSHPGPVKSPSSCLNSCRGPGPSGSGLSNNPVAMHHTWLLELHDFTLT